MSAPLVVVGAGLAGWSVVREFRRHDTDTPVHLVTADDGDFYPKPALSNALAQGRLPDSLVTIPAARMAEQQRVSLLPRHRVDAIDPAARRIVVQGVAMDYRDLVLATGARPIRLPLDGDAADRVLSVNALDDYRVLRARLAPASRVLILGAGLIGCEFANDLAVGGHPVTVLDPAERPLAALLPEAASRALQQSLATLGVDWRLGCTLARLDAEATCLRATLSDGRVLEADLVLSAVGLRPDLRLAQGAGLVTERGIVVDRLLRTSTAHVHALGDSAQYSDGDWAGGAVSGGRVLPYVMPIMSAARALGATLAGQATPCVFGPMPVAVKTPALPLVIATPALGSPGGWLADTDTAQAWHWRDGTGRLLGFALAGAATARRAQLTQALAG